jgi:hypothetical protein
MLFKWPREMLIALLDIDIESYVYSIGFKFKFLNQTGTPKQYLSSDPKY